MPSAIHSMGATKMSGRISAEKESGVSTVAKPRPAIMPMMFCTTMLTPKAATKTVKKEPSCRWIGR